MDAFKLLLFAAVLCMSMRTGLSADSYYRVSRKDGRKCAPPICGGYFIKKVNNVNETYVFAIRTDALPKDVQATYKNFIAQFPDKFDLVVYGGRLTRNTQSAISGFGLIFDLFVTNIYLGNPGVTVPLGPGIDYYSVSAPGIVAKASLLNTLKSVTVPTANVQTPSLIDFQDTSVQRRQILAKGALVLASTKALTVLVKQVFFKIPVTAGPCPLLKIACNTTTELVGYSRTPDLCFIPKCIKKPNRFLCPLIALSCTTPGYKLASWRNMRGCISFACDPVFFPNASKLDK